MSDVFNKKARQQLAPNSTITAHDSTNNSNIPYVPANPKRREVVIHNYSNFPMFISKGSSLNVLTNVYSHRMGPGETYVINDYKGVICCGWRTSSNNPSAVITETYFN